MEQKAFIQIAGRATSLTKGSQKKGLYIKTFGCQMNEYDSQKLVKILENSFELVTEPKEADLILINTCSVREKPEQKLYSILGQVSQFKKQNKKVMIGVGGCVAQQEGKNIINRSRSVDFVFGTHNLSLVPSLISQRESGAPPQVAIDYRDEWEELPLGFSENNRVSAMISISRGCNKNCTYCIVPTTRGAEVSRNPAEIEKEVRIAVHRGAKEIVLLGQTVNSYGLDLDPRLKFSELLNRLSTVAGLERIRFTSPHPQEVKKDFIDLVADNSKVCPHIHMPLQSGSDRILKLMNRNYRRDRYLSIVNALKEKVPNIGITTDIIVGFPDESEKDFRETLSMMEEVKFQNNYYFMFSPRPGTIAAEQMKDNISPEEKLSRLQRVEEVQKRITSERLGSFLGKTVEVLVEGPNQGNPSSLQGRNPENIMVHFIHSNPEAAIGKLLPIEIVETCKHTLRGVVCDSL